MWGVRLSASLAQATLSVNLVSDCEFSDKECLQEYYRNLGITVIFLIFFEIIGASIGAWIQTALENRQRYFENDVLH